MQTATITLYPSLEERDALASDRMDRFLDRVPPELRQEVQALPGRIDSMQAPASTRLQEVLDVADKVFGYAGPDVACARGCGHCCHVHVPIAAFEAEYIAENLGLEAMPIKSSIHHDRMVFSRETPCTFLRNGECSIYAYRPLTCRMHLNFDIDNTLCLHDNWHHPDATIPRPRINALIEAYYLLPGWGEPVVADIRDFFPNGRAV